MPAPPPFYASLWIRLILSPHAIDCRKQDMNTLYPPPSDRNIRLIETVDSKIGNGRTFPKQRWNKHAPKVKYTIATLYGMVVAKPTAPIDNIHKRPTFSKL